MIILDDVNKDIQQTILQISYRLQENLDGRVTNEIINNLLPLENQAGLISNVEDLSFPEIRSIIIAQTHWIMDLTSVVEIQEEAAIVLQAKISDLLVLLDRAESDLATSVKNYSDLKKEFIKVDGENTKLLENVSNYEQQLKEAAEDRLNAPSVSDVLHWQKYANEMEEKYLNMLDRLATIQIGRKLGLEVVSDTTES